MSLFSHFGALVAVFCAQVPFLVVMTMAVFSSFMLFPCVFVDCCVTYDNPPHQRHDNVAWTRRESFIDTIRSREATRQLTPAVKPRASDVSSLDVTVTLTVTPLIVTHADN
jgi:hypothetical protein